MEINNNTPLNFKASRIATVQKKLNPITEKYLKEIPPFEKIEVFRLNSTEDMPFAKKIVKYMESQNKKLNQTQQKLLESLRDFIKFPGNQRTYLSIKNDEHISGFSVISEPLKVLGNFKLKIKPKILDLVSTSNDSISLDTLRYSILSDKELAKEKMGLKDYKNHLNIDNNDIFGTITNKQYQKLRDTIKNRNTEYEMSITAQKEKFDLEEILNIKNVEV